MPFDFSLSGNYAPNPSPREGKVADETSVAFQKGYDSALGGCWWKGCTYWSDTQEFIDWQAGWRKAYLEKQAAWQESQKAYFRERGIVLPELDSLGTVHVFKGSSQAS